MPVSKKRKKEGKPVQRAQKPVTEGQEHPHGPEGKPAGPQLKTGKPTNPFVAQQTRRASQRGR
jgi:hypothetical protein